MDTAVQIERAIAPTNSTTTPEASNEVGHSNTHGDSNGEISVGTGIGGAGQDSMSDSPRSSLSVEFDFLWKLRKYLILLAGLAVGVTYNSGLTPPGGFWNRTKDGHEAGDPTLRVEFYQRYEIFFYCNATAFAASLVLIILLLSKRVTKQELWLRSMQFTMLVDLFSLMAAYVAGSCRALKSSIYILVLFIIAFAYIFIHILVSTRMVPETFKKKVSTKANEILSKLGIPDVQSSRKNKKDLEEAQKFILMLVTFAATVTYQAGLSPPGGFWAENDYKQRPATPVLRRHHLDRYNIFISCNSTSFVASLVTIILLLSPELSRHGIRSKAVIVCVLADLFSLIFAYAAGCCRDVATSFYVMFIIIIVLICIVLLAWIFAYGPVAECLRKIKSSTKRWCMSVLSSNYGSNRLSNADQEGSNATYQQASVHGPGAPTGEPELQSTVIQHVSNTEESSVEYPPEDNRETENSGESFSNSLHTSVNSPQSTNIKDLVSNMHHESTDNQLAVNMKESLTSTERPSFSCKETSDSNGMSADRQQVVGMNEEKSSDDVRTTDMPANGSSAQTMLASNSNGATDDITEDEMPAETGVNVESAEQKTSMGYSNHATENGGVNTNAECETGNGCIDNNQEVPDKKSHENSTEDHVEKTRRYLLLLAILAVSLTYQSGLNPPGGFWSASKKNSHSAGDRILEDNDHPRFIAFFYLNAVAFVASIVIIVMLLDRTMSRKATKYRELQLAMIVDLLSLTGAFVMGSCREPKKSISTSVLLFLVPAYVTLHVLAIHVISPLVPDKVKQLSCGNVCFSFLQLSHKKTGNKTEAKELERRRNLLLTLAIIAATVTYQAGINPPGSVWSDDKDVSGRPGNPILQDNHPRRYDVFYYSNSITFMSSVAITILLVNKESCERGIKSYALRVCLVVGLVGLLVAYVAGSCRYKKQSIFVIIIAVAVLVSLVVQFLLSSMYQTLGQPLAKLMECLQQLMEYLQRCFFRTEMVRREITPQSPETKESDKKRERKRHKYLMLIATLAASVTYQAGLNPPGGFWSNDNGHFAGDPLLRDINHGRYKTFFCFNAISFMASIVVIMLLLSKSFRKKPVRLEVLLLIMILDLLSVMTAFAAGSCRKLSTSIYVFLLVAGVVVYLVFLLVISRAIGKCRKKWKTVDLFCSRCACVSSTNTIVPREQV